MKPIVRKWIEIADYDFKTARAMFKSSRYLYVVFMCQQAAEKIIKALIVLNEDEFPPKIHKLESLAIRANISDDLSDEQRELLNELSFYYLNNRYPDFKMEVSKLMSKRKAHEILKKTEMFIKWVKLKLK